MTPFQRIPPQPKDLGGGFTVRRLLPAVQRQAVGPFLFFDHFGPVDAAPGDNHDVRPHPHIGLATVTYLYEGAIEHRDSTGAVQRIEPGAVNWMTAGRGIVHSERTPADLRGRSHRTHGLQLWAALPVEHEEAEPAFAHTPAAAIPELSIDGVTVRVLIGKAFGRLSPVRTLSNMLYVDFAFRAGSALTVPAAATERALYGVDQAFELDGQAVPACTMVLLGEGDEPVLRAPEAARIVMVGGAPLGHRHMLWNFVSSRPERIGRAQDDWEAHTAAPDLARAGGFQGVAGDAEFIPLPARRR